MTRWLTIPVLGGLAAWAFPAMADAALKATCLLAVVLLAEVALRRRGAAVRHLLLVAMFGLLLALPALTLVLPGWQVLPQWLHVPAVDDALTATESEPAAAADILPGEVIAPGTAGEFTDPPTIEVGGTGMDRIVLEPPVSFAEAAWEAPPAISNRTAGEIEIADEPAAVASGALSRTTRNACVLAWLAGTALLLLRILFGAGLLWRARRGAALVSDGPLYELLEQLRVELAVRRPVRLLLGDNRAMPMAWGLWRACILVPSGIEAWTPSQRRAVLLHELGHVARRDPLWQLIVELGRAVYWFHPLVWLAAWRVHVERERACDDLVISRGVAAQDYARHLLDVVSRGRLRAARPAIGVAMASNSKLEGRVRSILDERRNRRPVTRTVAAVGLLACVVIGLPLAMMRANDDRSVAPNNLDSAVRPDNTDSAPAIDSGTETAAIDVNPTTANWGEMVDGIQARLRTDKAQWSDDEYPAFTLDLRNLRDHEIRERRAVDFCDLEIDGTWYQCVASNQTRIFDLLAVEQQMDEWLSLTLGDTWVEKTADGLARRRISDSDRCLPLTPGQHSIRAAFHFRSTPGAAANVRVLTNTLDMTITEIESKWGPPRDELQVRLRPDRLRWTVGESPAFAIDLKNDGDRVFQYIRSPEIQCQVEFDGQWYRWGREAAYDSPTQRLYCGQRLLSLMRITLEGWVSTEDATPLALTPGTHVVRVSFSHEGQPRGISDFVSIEIVANDDVEEADSDSRQTRRFTPAVEPASPEAVTRRVRELLYILRQHRGFSRSDSWGSAIREMIEIGESAVPELVAELDRTDRNLTLRALGFTLRAIDDPRAVPALIHNIPKALQPPGSDLGIYIRDPELRTFLNEHERVDDQDDSVTYGRPVNEVLDALQKLTGHSEPADSENDPLRHVILRGGPEQRAAAQEAYAERQAHWEQWWSEHQDEFVTDEAMQSLELPPHDGDLVEEAGVARFGPLFPTGPDVRLGPVHEVQLGSYSYWDAPSHFDFDTGRIFQYLEGAEKLEPDSSDDPFSLMVNWPADMGIDVRLNEGDDLHVWQIDDERWDTLEDEIRTGMPLQLGPEATDWLVRFEGHYANFQYDQIGTFLFTTREGGRGIVQSHPRDVLTGEIRLRYRMWIDGPAEPAPPQERPRDRTGPAFGDAVTMTLQTPGRGKAFLLNLNTGEAVKPPDSVIPADATAQFWFGDSEEFVDWCRDNEIDLAAHLTQFESEAPGASGMRVSLIGLGTMERHILPSAFDEMTVPEAREILDRYPERNKHAFLSPTADIPHQPDTFVIETRGGRIGLLRIWEAEEDGSSVTIHFRLAPDHQARAGADAGGMIRGRVLDTDRRPLANAGVWFSMDILSADENGVSASTDAEGRFELAVPVDRLEFPGRTVWVWHAAHGLGMADVWSQFHGDRTDEVTITLDRPEEPAVFELFHPDGTSAYQAQVTPLHVKTPDGMFLYVPVGLREQLQQSADEQGRVAFRTVPRELLNSVRIDADGFGTQMLHLGLDGYVERDRTILLGAAGRIEGRIQTDDPMLLEGLTLYFETRDSGWQDPFWSSGDENEIERRLRDGDHPRKTRGTATVRVAADGRFAVPAIANGRLVINSSLDEAATHGVRLVDIPVHVAAGRTQEISINIAPRVAVRCTVVNGETGEPVPAAIVSVNDGDDRGEPVVTDGNGQFSCELLAGEVELVVNLVRDAPDGWRQDSDSWVVVMPADDERPVTLPDVVISQGDGVSAQPTAPIRNGHGSLSIDYNVIGGPEEATFMLNRRPIRVRNGERRVVEKLFPGTYWLASRNDIFFPDFGIQCHLDRRVIQIDVDTETQTRFVRDQGARVLGRVLGLRDLVGDFGVLERQ